MSKQLQFKESNTFWLPFLLIESMFQLEYEKGNKK